VAPQLVVPDAPDVALPDPSFQPLPGDIVVPDATTGIEVAPNP
jgi:hypothetical protein